MIEPNHDKQMDELLDSLLSEYSAVEPRPGLETRICAGLRAHAAQQHRRWLKMLVFAVSLGVAVLAVMDARMRVSPAPAPRDLASQKSSPASALLTTRRVPSSSQPKAREAVYGRRPNLHVQSSTPILLQIANAVPASDNLVFEHQKLYLTAAVPKEQEPAEEQQPSVPSMSIQHLDVRPIEIKDISPAKEIGSER